MKFYCLTVTSMNGEGHWIWGEGEGKSKWDAHLMTWWVSTKTVDEDTVESWCGDGDL